MELLLVGLRLYFGCVKLSWCAYDLYENLRTFQLPICHISMVMALAVSSFTAINQSLIACSFRQVHANFVNYNHIQLHTYVCIYIYLFNASTTVVQQLNIIAEALQHATHKFNSPQNVIAACHLQHCWLHLQKIIWLTDWLTNWLAVWLITTNVPVHVWQLCQILWYFVNVCGNQVNMLFMPHKLVQHCWLQQ